MQNLIDSRCMSNCILISVGRLSLLKAATLNYLGLYEEAIQQLSSLISLYTEAAGPVAEDLSSLSAIRLEK